MKELERENVRLKRLVADLSVEKQILKDVASGILLSGPMIQAPFCKSTTLEFIL